MSVVTLKSMHRQITLKTKLIDDAVRDKTEIHFLGKSLGQTVLIHASNRCLLISTLLLYFVLSAFDYDTNDAIATPCTSTIRGGHVRPPRKYSGD